MPTDLAGKQDGVPERFTPTEMRGQLIEAEHFARYRWAMTVASGKRVLDAGCGTAYGSAMLAGGDAMEVVGVDLATNVLESVRPEMPERVRLDVGDLRDLPYDDSSFNLVVCFEVIEHIDDFTSVLDQLTRVLAPDGMLLISSPNRGIYPSGNPHHLHEFRPPELAAELGDRLRDVQLFRQQAYIGSAILSNDQYVASSERPLDELPVYKLAHGALDQELYTLAAASDSALPEMPSLALLTSHLSLNEWTKIAEDQEHRLHAQRVYIRDLESQIADRAQLQVLLTEAEQNITDINALESRATELKRENELLKLSASELTVLRHSSSWRLTRPLRTAMNRLRAFRQRSGR